MKQSFPGQKARRSDKECIIPVWEVVKHAIKYLWREVLTSLIHDLDLRWNDGAAIIIDNVEDHSAALDVRRFLPKTGAPDNRCQH